MLELIYMSLLGIAYSNALISEAKQEIIQKEKERIRDLKIKVFCYAIRHNLLYNEVVESLQKKKITFDELND